jgi:hypothetical protein
MVPMKLVFEVLILGEPFDCTRVTTDRLSTTRSESTRMIPVPAFLATVKDNCQGQLFRLLFGLAGLYSFGLIKYVHILHIGYLPLFLDL